MIALALSFDLDFIEADPVGSIKSNDECCLGGGNNVNVFMSFKLISGQVNELFRLIIPYAHTFFLAIE